jgi:hypothetical protein
MKTHTLEMSLLGFYPSLPPDHSVETFPCKFIADETSPVKINLMGPYPRRILIKDLYLNTYFQVSERVSSVLLVYKMSSSRYAATKKL